MVVAVDRGSNGVGLYRIGRDRRAVPVATIAPPDVTSTPFEVTLSAGARPDLCVVWAGSNDGDRQRPSELRCYAYGDTTGRRIPVTGAPAGAVALRPDGRALAWTANPTLAPGTPEGEAQEFVTARFEGGRVSDVRRRPTYVADGSSSPEFACSGGWVEAATWVDDGHVLIQCPGENDYPGPLVVQALESAGSGRTIADEDEPPYNYLTRVRSADATSALAIQGEWCEIECADRQPLAPRRAVRFSLATGRVIEVVSTPLPGRSVTSVSGGTNGIVYVTDGAGGARVYVRRPGEKRGQPVSGLPGDLGDDVLAQP